MHEGPPVIEEGLIERVTGKYLLVGLTILSPDGDVVQQREMHGRVRAVSVAEGLVVVSPNGQEWRLPPEAGGLEPAPPGRYRLRSTGEEIQDPDFFYNWTISLTRDGTWPMHRP